MTKAQTERLAILVEECAEVVQIAMKILRHGEDSFNPNDPDETGNMQLLEKEIGDVTFAIKMMTAHSDISMNGIVYNSKEKKKIIIPYLHSSENVLYCSKQ